MTADRGTITGIATVVRREARLHPGRSLALVCLAGLLGLSNLAIPLFLETALDAVAGVGEQALLWPALGALAILGLGRGTVSWLRDTLLRRLRRRRVAEIDRDLVRRAMHAPRGALEPIGPGAAADAVASGDRIGAYLFGELPSVLAEAATGIALLILLWTYDWRMGCLGVVLAAWNGVLIWRLAAREADLSAARAETEARLAQRLEAGLAALTPVRLGGLETVALAAWSRALDKRLGQLIAALTRGEGAAARQMAVSGAAQAIVLGLGGALMATSPGFTVGDLFACSALIFALNDPARRLLAAHADGSKATAELLRRSELLKFEPDPQRPAEPSPDCARIADATREDWKRMAANRPGAILITGPTELLPGTLAENVTLTAPLDADRMSHALSLACLDRELGARGLDSRVSAGTTELSTGQRQRLAIARALYVGPSAILIAEGMEYLDRSTAARLMDNLLSSGIGVLVADSPQIADLLGHLPVRRGLG